GCSARRYSKGFIFSPCERRLSLAARALRGLDSRYDPWIGTTAADIAAHPLANLFGGELNWPGFRDVGGDKAGVAPLGFTQQRNAGADLSRGAIAALEAVMLQESSLQRMKFLAVG